jgi:hypothetical protein
MAGALVLKMDLWILLVDYEVTAFYWSLILLTLVFNTLWIDILHTTRETSPSVSQFSVFGSQF